MRKYDIKNKRNIGIIIGISIIIIIMFSLVIKLFLSSDKKEYTVHDGTLVFDKDKSIIKVTEDSTIKKKWNNEYYLKFKDNNYELGNTAISYNEKTGEIILYGKYYEIGSGDLIDVTDGETVIKSSVITKFYKLADRKYLVVDKDIKTSDGLLSTNEFLMIDLDKVGNATLVNHKVNLKAFAATSIVTSNYTFDIANEILTYGSNKIDLKKIIGSSNTYTKEDLIPEENDNSSSNDGVTNITDNTIGGNGTNGGNDATGDNKGTDDMIKRAFSEGHSIGLHTYTHDYATVYSSEDADFADLQKISDLVESITGTKSRIIRFPGGSSNTVSAKYVKGLMTTLTKAVRDKGYQYFDWNCDSTDASGNNVPVEKLVSNATSCTANHVDILMHDTDAKDTTVQALPQIIDYYRSQGYTFKGLTVDSVAAHHGVNN